jgi:hypothetical protein
MSRRNVTGIVTFLSPLRYGQGVWKFTMLQSTSAPLDLTYATKAEAKQAYDDMGRMPNAVKVPRGKLFGAIALALKQATGVEHAA